MAIINFRNLAVWGGTFVGFVFGGAVNDSFGQDTNTNVTPLRAFMAEAGQKLSCYFTLEEFDSTNSRSSTSALHSGLLLNLRTPATEAELAKQLADELPEYNIFQDQKTPQIIHIVDKELSTVTNYPLTQKTDIYYEGPLGGGQGGGLAAEIGKKVAGIGPGLGGNWRDAFDDYSTTVKINGKSLEVRTILSEVLPLEKYNQFLWLAKTTEHDGKFHTTIRFYGQKK